MPPHIAREFNDSDATIFDVDSITKSLPEHERSIVAAFNTNKAGSKERFNRVYKDSIFQEVKR